jgi:hypothetical protein
MRPLPEPSTLLRTLPPARALILTAIATLLAAADWLPANPYVDPDHLEFALTLLLGASAIGLCLHERMSAAAVRQWRLRLLLSLCTIAFSIAVAEPATRWIFRDVTTSSDNGGYFSRRWYRTGAVKTNNLGFRERNFAAVKSPGSYRIAVVGDSFTFGNGVRQQDRYSDLLQAELPAKFEVLNFGVAGANTPEHLTSIQRIVPQFHPDFVLLQWYVNDVEDDDSTGRPASMPLVPFRWLHNWLNDASALYTVANMQWAETQSAMGFTDSYTDYLHRRLGDPNSHDSLLDRGLLRALVEYCRKQGVPIGIVLFPDTAGGLGADYAFGYLHDRVLDTCGAESITCLDLREDFAGVKHRQSLWANKLDHHPSARANAIAAERILETYSGVWAASPSR